MKSLVRMPIIGFATNSIPSKDLIGSVWVTSVGATDQLLSGGSRYRDSPCSSYNEDHSSCLQISCLLDGFCVEANLS
jgi:hypothetical protein